MKTNSVKLLSLIFFISLLLPQYACKKQDDWLDIKRNKGDVVPQTLADFQAILDNTNKLNNLFNLAAAVGTDNVYINDVNLAGSSEDDRNLYLWNREIWSNGISYGWNGFYEMIELSNIVLDGLEKLDKNASEHNWVKGQALFWRAYGFYCLAQMFAKPYDAKSANTDLGIPLRLSSDVNIIYQRPTNQKTYGQILIDIITAIDLLPRTAKYITRPNRAAAMGLAARIYLNMDNYELAFKYADNAIKDSPNLLDFNNGLSNLAATYRFPAYGNGNPEVLFLAMGNGHISVLPGTFNNSGFVAEELYNSYHNNDLRKSLFYAKDVATGLYKIRGTYSGLSTAFNGIATNEAYLIRAECFARANDKEQAMIDLNLLLKNRYKKGTFIDLTATTPDEALKMVLTERRKELAFVGILRWEDLRRLNKDPKFAITIYRNTKGNQIALPPNDQRYVLPIPDNEIQLTGIKQNER